MTKFTFILKNVDIKSINEKYKFNSSSSKNIGEEIAPEINISETNNNITLINTKEPEHITSFLDENKRKIKTVSCGSISFDNAKGLSCFWCKHEITTTPLGCPIKWINSSIEKTYTSALTKEKHYIKENITHTKLNKIHNLTEPIFSIPLTISEDINEYFLTDGIFCSFNCILAYIKDNNTNTLYSESSMLIRMMYEKLTGNSIENKVFLPAPHWRMLQKFGGPLSIEEFRSKFNTEHYEYLFTTDKNNTISKPLSTFFRLK